MINDKKLDNEYLRKDFDNSNRYDILKNNINHEIEYLISESIINSIDINDFNINNIDIDNYMIELKNKILKEVLNNE